ncbi:MAG TPA: C4-type zinc ribbon domain-containing protein [Acidobacteriaceae bacterium]|nr:C4-type zinc ribbon domain-containing protein [Acidobacteriaceae bacterium]
MLDSRPRMDVQTQLLVRLQQVDIRIVEVQDTIAALPRQLRSAEEQLQQQKLILERAEKAVPAEEARRRRLESDRKDQQQKLVKYREQSSSVKTNEQFHALQHEIGFVEAEIRRIEDEELTSMIQSEGLESERNEARKAVALQVKAVDAEKERVGLSVQEQQKELSHLKQQRTEIRKEVSEPLLAQYDRIASSSRKTALARAAGQRCMACQMAMRPQFWNQVREGTLLNCESCGRLLYFDPNRADLAPAST